MKPAVSPARLLVFLAALVVTTNGWSASDIICSNCHTCAHPHADEPCLDELCPRHVAMKNLHADIGPDIVMLDEMENLYVAVEFNHKAHANMVELSGGCETCHHYTPPDAEHPACVECHPKEIMHEDIRQPGLKGAYHRNCMNCHSDWDKDTACEICHVRKVPGVQAPVHMEKHYQPLPLDELIIFKTDYEEGDEVPFHHRNHSELYERDCNECHQQQSCSRCHIQGSEPHPMGDLEEIDLHDTCYDCHEGQGCDACHGREPDDLFKHDDIGWPLKSYHQDLSCRTCHGTEGAFRKLDKACTTCHVSEWLAGRFDHRTTGVPLGDLHRDLDCESCHPGCPGVPSICDGCHDDGRIYNKETGFGGT